MRIIVAPDSYKGSVTALAAAQAMKRGVLSVFPEAEVLQAPIADGGEGTVETLVIATNGRTMREKVTGPLGETVPAQWGILGDGETAVIEMAAASGLTLVPKEKRDPRITTTLGTGQLITAALDKGIRKIIIGIGGSATNDGGAGTARALGVRFLNAAGKELPNGGAALAKLASIDLCGLDPRVKEAEILVACDVDNPLCGPRGASAVYGPQKGATPEMIIELDKALENYARIAATATGKDVAARPGSGAAGGLGAGLLFFTNAKLRPGIELVIEATQFNDMVATADLVITGEGLTDLQTAQGKAPIGIARAAKQYHVPVICLSGGLGKGADDVYDQGIDGLMSIVPGPMTLEQSMQDGEALIESATARLCRSIKVGMQMGKKIRASSNTFF
jgi:glycerate kinase